MAQLQVPTEIICKACERPIGEPNPYRYAVHEYRAQTMDSTPDGTAMVIFNDAGAFCSAECLLRYLAVKTGLVKALGRAREAAGNVSTGLMISSERLAKHEPDNTETILGIEKRYRKTADAAWDEVDRLIGARGGIVDAHHQG